jgi:hypothetical protein
LRSSVARRVPRPEELVEAQLEYTPDQRVRPIRCQVGRASDNPCPRDAVVGPCPEQTLYPARCEEHARAYEVSLEAGEWSVAEEVTGDWLRIAQAWGFEALEGIAAHAHEDARMGFLKADVRADLAHEIADAPRKSRNDKIADLTPEQDAEPRRLIRRSDALMNARTALEDMPPAR